jgi:hypothetical protein
MQGRSRLENYQCFVAFVAADLQQERNRLNRRMLTVAFWCFFLPIFCSLILLILVKFGVFPKSAKNHIDGLILILPVSYSLYFLSSEVLSQLPALFRKGAWAATLGQTTRDGEWRERVCEAMHRALPATEKEWQWVIQNFKVDLQIMKYRTRYLTALAGAVFYLIMQGIDFFSDEEVNHHWARISSSGWIESGPTSLPQLMGLGLFLLLLYLSGSQTYHILARYLSCAELVSQHWVSGPRKNHT